MFWCTSCSKGQCIIDPYLQQATTFNRINRSKRIDKIVRIPASLRTMKKNSLVVSKERRKNDTPDNGPSDRARPSINPITQSSGVDKKYGSYARYLALKKGNLIRADNWKYVDITPIGNTAYIPYAGTNKLNQGYSKTCCCTETCG